MSSLLAQQLMMGATFILDRQDENDAQRRNFSMQYIYNVTIFCTEIVCNTYTKVADLMDWSATQVFFGGKLPFTPESLVQ